MSDEDGLFRRKVEEVGEMLNALDPSVGAIAFCTFGAVVRIPAYPSEEPTAAKFMRLVMMMLADQELTLELIEHMLARARRYGLDREDLEDLRALLQTSVVGSLSGTATLQ